MNSTVGYTEGELCNRDNCQGIIHEAEKEGCCSCHINPPCSYCTTDSSYCEVCGYDGREEQLEYEKNQSTNHISGYQPFKIRTINDLDKSKIDWISLPHTYMSMIKQGVYPAGTTREEVFQKVQGTFGGRFNYFGDGRFEFVAYTD